MGDPARRRHTLAAAFGYAFEGLAAAWRTQRNVRIQAAITLVVAAGGVLLRFSAVSWAVIALAIALVVTAELANTAMEAIVDLVSPEDHPLAKRAKDVAAAGVLVATLGAVAAGICVLVRTFSGP
ncbi:MAG: diacylglycerol kinase [Candidatus Eremiobacteraeota bacterium]|nr:diacylglycerol kinase [Candidatus Eremiobacteraeota bacterium]